MVTKNTHLSSLGVVLEPCNFKNEIWGVFRPFIQRSLCRYVLMQCINPWQKTKWFLDKVWPNLQIVWPLKTDALGAGSLRQSFKENELMTKFINLARAGRLNEGSVCTTLHCTLGHEYFCKCLLEFNKMSCSPLKVGKFQTEFIKSSFLPEYEWKIVRISFMFGDKQWLHKFILKFTDL